LVLKANYDRHLNQNRYPHTEFLKAFRDDLGFSGTSTSYAVYNNASVLVGAIRAMEWNKIDKLPIEKDFNINMDDFLTSLSIAPKKVWHIGRFAIDHKALICDQCLKYKRITILKLLLFSAFKHVAEDKDSIAIAECDSKLFEKLKLFNIHSEIIGESKTYLGSLTIPIYNTSAGVKEFVELNKELFYVQ